MKGIDQLKNDFVFGLDIYPGNICSLDLQGWRLLVNCVQMLEQRTGKLTLNSVFDIKKLIPLFTVSGQKVTLSNVVN